MSAFSSPKVIAPPSLKIETDLDIQHAEAVHNLLLAQPASAFAELDLSSVASCDLTGIQLLVAARVTATAAGKKFSISAFSPSVIAACTGLGLDVSQLSTSAL